MKKFLFLLLAFVTLTFVSCQKENIFPTDTTTIPDTTQMEVMSIYGKWKLIDAFMYVDNLETGAKTKYAHFGPNKNVSNLRYSGSILDIEIIEKDITTWEFTKPSMVPSYGKFILNNNPTELYGFYVTTSNWTIVEDPTVTLAADMNLGGSSRPVKAYIDNYAQGTCKIYVQESYENINGYNCKCFNELVFKKIE